MIVVKVTLSRLAKEACERTGATPFDIIGFVFVGLAENAPGSAVEQLDRHYQHGGGWRPTKGFKLSAEGLADPNDDFVARLLYPGDPPMRLIAWAKLRDELVMLFESSWVCVYSREAGSVVARMD